MKLPRRKFFHLAAAAAALLAVPRIASTQAYPTRALRCIIGYAPGGGTDIFVRLVGRSLAAYLGQPLALLIKSDSTHSKRPDPLGCEAGLAMTAFRPVTKRPVMTKTILVEAV